MCINLSIHIYIIYISVFLSIYLLQAAVKKKAKYEEEDEFDESEDAESDITESDFEDPDEMEVYYCR